MRRGEEDAGKIAQEYRQASTQQEREYAETAAALAEKQETDHKLTAAINHAKDHGDLATLRNIAEDRRNRLGFILRQGWTALDFGEEREITQLRRLWARIELEIIPVLEAGTALKESLDYELHGLTTQTPAFFDETVRRHIATLEKDVAVFAGEAEELAKEIEDLTGEAVLV